MSNEISHIGKVLEVTPQYTTVEIVSESACSSCHAKTLCGYVESDVKVMDIPTKATDDYKVGDEVYVNLKTTLGHRAVWAAYVAPLAAMCIAILVLYLVGASELCMGLGALGAVAGYYLLLYLFKDKIADEYVFYLKRK